MYYVSQLAKWDVMPTGNEKVSPLKLLLASGGLQVPDMYSTTET